MKVRAQKYARAMLLRESALEAWGRDFLDELTAFPASPHDDMTDSFVMALDYLSAHTWSLSPEEREAVMEAQRRIWNKPMVGWDSTSPWNPLSAAHRLAGTGPDSVAARDAAADAGGRNVRGIGLGRSGSHFTWVEEDDAPARGPLGLPRGFRTW